jgi:GlpG protein
MIRALQVESGRDLRPFLMALQQQGIRSRVTEESGKQVLWVPSEADAHAALALMQHWQSTGYATGVAEPDPIPSEDEYGVGQHRPLNSEALFSPAAMKAGLFAAFLQAPITLLLVALCLGVALLSRLGSVLEPVELLFFPAFDLREGLLSIPAQIDSAGTALRLLTPALLHFGPLHLVFNLLWLWYLGRMIEALHPGWRYALLILVTALAANLIQYAYAGSPYFGGMSGVVYGLIGYIAAWQFLARETRLRLPPGMIVVFLVTLVLMEVFASSWIATAAHVGGLLAGVIAGAVAGMVNQIARNP